MGAVDRVDLDIWRGQFLAIVADRMPVTPTEPLPKPGRPTGPPTRALAQPSPGPDLVATGPPVQ
ncbi:MAG: hypothetical protein ACRDZX_14050 [Acidimicrobiales bacterium]